jgi:hypothetical protein
MTMHTSRGTGNKVIFIVALDEEMFARFDIMPVLSKLAKNFIASR